MDLGNYSPAILHKISYAGANKISFREGSKDLLELAELAVPEKQVERLSERIGMERLAERTTELEHFQKLTLVERCDGVPQGVAPPPTAHVAVIMADAGMMQLRDAAEEEQAGAILPFATAPATSDKPMSICPPATVALPEEGAASAPTTPAAAPAAPHSGCADDAGQDDDLDQRPSGRHWHEDKVGLVMTMASEQHQADPCPKIPEGFLDPVRVAKLVRGLKKEAALGDDGLKEPDVTESEEATPAADYEGPKLATRKVVATRTAWPDFGPILASAAWLLGFAQAARKAFVADGARSIWTMWRRHFSSYVPILDFIHALSYVFAAAKAVGTDLASGWLLFVPWIQWVWQGDVAKVIEALKAWESEAHPEKGADEANCRKVVQRALTYLTNHQDKMQYADYRRLGLPIVSSLVESMVKQINRRVKGTEKFWGEEGAEAILQLRADYLSDGDVMEEFWERRQDAATGQRQYRKAS
jgi:hypothetical protein